MSDFPRVDAILEAEAAYNTDTCIDACECDHDYGLPGCVCHCHAQVREAESALTDADVAELRRRASQEVSRQNAVILVAEAIVRDAHEDDQ